MRTRKPTDVELAQHQAFCNPLREQIKKISIHNNYEGGLTDKQRKLIDEIESWEARNGFLISVNGVRKII